MDFAPGFRISRTDTAALIAGVLGAAFTFNTAWWMGAVIAFTVGHFFLFCNVFRVARPLEMGWAVTFVALSIGTLSTGQPGWLLTFGVTFAMTAVVIGTQLRSPLYHGAFWARINPGLRERWSARPDTARS